MIDQINELPNDGLKSSPETSRYTENKWISLKNQNKLYFLHFIDILNYLLLICQITISLLHRSLFIDTSLDSYIIHHWIHRSLYCRSYKRKSISMLSDQQFSLENPKYVFK